MVFTSESFSVQFWVKRIRKGNATREDVPNLFNLRDVVYSIIDN